MSATSGFREAALRSKRPCGLVRARELQNLAQMARARNATAHLSERQRIEVQLALEDSAFVPRTEVSGPIVTLSPLAGLSPVEPFDPTGQALSAADGLADVATRERRLRVHFAGAPEPSWNPFSVDVALTATRRIGRAGFEVRLGGGSGGVLNAGALLAEFLAEADLMPVLHALLRSLSERPYAPGDVERVRAEVRALYDPAEDPPAGPACAWEEEPRREPAARFRAWRTTEEASWLRDDVLRQRQVGYAAVHVAVPSAELSADQLLGLAGIIGEHGAGALRVTPRRDLLLPWIPFDRLFDVHAALVDLDLSPAGERGSRAAS